MHGAAEYEGFWPLCTILNLETTNVTTQKTMKCALFHI